MKVKQMFSAGQIASKSCHTTTAVLLFMAAIAAPAMAWAGGQANDENWPNWRGPHGDGRAAEKSQPPIKWSATENVVWKVAIPGRGVNTPIVWENKIFLLTAVPTNPAAEPAPEAGGRGGRRGGRGGSPPGGEQSLVVMCLNRADGSVIWSKEVMRAVPHEGLHSTNTYSSASAVTDGERLFASFGSFGIFCLNLDGEVLWSRDLGNMQTRNSFGEGGSPALWKDTLVVPWDHEGPSQLFALDAKSGEIKWKVDRDEPTTWATPLITEFDGRVQVITNGKVRVRSYDLENGELIWECGGQASNPIPSPLRIDDMVICMTGYQGYAIQAIPLSSKGDITGTSSVIWSREDSAPYVSSAVIQDGKLFFTKGRDAIGGVVDARTGELLVDQTRLPGLDTLYASPIAAAGRVYYSGRNGNTLVMEYRDGKLEFLATNELGEPIDASPVAIGDQLLLRGERHLFCLEEDSARPAQPR